MTRTMGELEKTRQRTSECDLHDDRRCYAPRCLNRCKSTTVAWFGIGARSAKCQAISLPGSDRQPKSLLRGSEHCSERTGWSTRNLRSEDQSMYSAAPPPAHLYATPPLHSICIGPASAAERLPSKRCIESARTHRARACAPPLRASDTT
jgi:hypothetical protein